MLRKFVVTDTPTPTITSFLSLGEEEEEKLCLSKPHSSTMAGMGPILRTTVLSDTAGCATGYFGIGQPATQPDGRLFKRTSRVSG